MHEVVKASREVGALIMMECQAHQLRMIDPDIQDSLRSVDIFVPNAAEAMLLTETSSVEDAIRLLAELIPITVIKLGKDGAVAAEGPKVVWEPAIKVDVVDTTGAGDNFDCGFLYGYLKGLSLQDCLRCGNICGGQSTTRCGGTAASPSMKQLEEFLNCSYP
jgi:hypothetical protein